MWTLYDRMIELADENDTIRELRIGPNWTGIITEKGRLGVAASYADFPMNWEQYLGMSLREAARAVKSWNFRESAIGLAAVNACVNRSERFPEQKNPDAFLHYKELCKGKSVAVIGRFPYLEDRLGTVCSDLFVLERKPDPALYPDTACEYILPKVNVVYITGCAAANKTLPRLLQLSRNAYTIVTGPSTCMDPMMFSFGADSLCGFCVTDEAAFRNCLDDCSAIFSCGRMICLEKE